MITTLKIEGMSCPNCVRHVHDALANLPGVQEAVVSLEAKTAIVTHDEAVSSQSMILAVDEEGYTASTS